MTYQDTYPDSTSRSTGGPKGEESSGPRGVGRRKVRGTRKASDATGINPEARAPIDPRMPNLPPA